MKETMLTQLLNESNVVIASSTLINGGSIITFINNEDKVIVQTDYPAHAKRETLLFLLERSFLKVISIHIKSVF